MIMLAMIVALGVASSCIQNYYCKSLFKSTGDDLVYEMIVFSFALLGSLTVLRLPRPSFYTVKLAVAAGIVFTAETYSILEAMRCGSMSLTMMFSLAALIIPVVCSPFLWNEELKATQLAGTVLVIISMMLILDIFGEIRRIKEASEGGAHMPAGGSAGSIEKRAGAAAGKTGYAGINPRWLLFSSAAFFSGGLMAIIEKYVTTSPHAGETDSYVVICFAAVIATSFAVLIFKIKKHSEKITFRPTVKNVIPMAFIGAASAGIFVLTVEAIKILPTSLVYAGNNGARLMLISALDVLLFGQKLNRQQYAGLAAGFAAIILLSL